MPCKFKSAMFDYILDKLTRNRHVLVFNHIPKASGTSVIHVLRENYGNKLLKWHPEFNPQDQYIEERNFKFDCVASHYGYGIQNIFRDNWRYHHGATSGTALYDEYRSRFARRDKAFDSAQFKPLPGIFNRNIQWVTIVRDPVERLISYYNFVTTFQVHRHYEKTKHMGVREFFDFLISIEDAEISNLQCGLLSNRRDAAATIDVIESQYLIAFPIVEHDAFLTALAKIKGLANKNAVRLTVSEKKVGRAGDLPRGV